MKEALLMNIGKCLGHLLGYVSDLEILQNFTSLASLSG